MIVEIRVYRRKLLSLYDSCLENDVESMKRTECSISLTVRDETDDSSSIWGSISLKAFRLFFRSVRERIRLFLFKRLRIDLLFLDRETLFISFISKKLLSIKLFYYLFFTNYINLISFPLSSNFYNSIWRLWELWRRKN